MNEKLAPWVLPLIGGGAQSLAVGLSTGFAPATPGAAAPNLWAPAGTAAATAASTQAAQQAKDEAEAKEREADLRRKKMLNDAMGIALLVGGVVAVISIFKMLFKRPTRSRR